MKRFLPFAGHFTAPCPIRLLLHCLLCLAFLILPAELTAHPEGCHVLVLNSYHQGYTWSDTIMEGITEIFAESELQADLSIEYMDAQEHETATIFPRLEALYQTKFAARHSPFDVVIVSDNEALDFLLPRRELLLPGVPVVFTGINDFDDELIAGEREITGVAEEYDLLAIIDTALSLHPGTRNLAVVSDITPSGRINHQRFLEIEPALPAGLHTLDLTGLTAAELQRQLAALPDHTIVLNLSFDRDPSGQVFSPEESMALLLESSRAPIYTAWAFLVRRGALGGIVVSGRRQGEEAARMAIEIFGGKSTEAIPILRESPNVAMFNYPQMQRFGLSKADLPAGSLIVGEPETFYHHYRYYIWTAVSLLLLQMSIISGLIVNILRRQRAEAKLAGYQEHLEELVRERTAALESANARLQEEMSKQQQTEHFLRESEEKYRSLVELANDGILIIQNESFRYVNPAMAALLGYTTEELLGLTLARISPPAAYQALRERHRRWTAGEKMPIKYETILLARNGELIEVEFNAGIIHYQGQPASLALVRDVRERRQLEEKRAQVGKLESIGVLAGGLAHDFNNLLTVVMGSVSLVRSLAAKDQRTAALLDRADQAALKARDLARQLITFAEGGAPRKEQVNLSEILEQAAESALSGTGSRGRFRLAADLRPVPGDPDQLRQLVAILVTNASEAMAGAGEVEISAASVELAEQELNNLEAGPYVKFTCTDRGSGIAPENLPRLFDPYFSTKAMGSRKGTGLGLSIAYSIARRHHGHIEVQSRVGRGTSVSVYLPAAEES